MPHNEPTTDKIWASDISRPDKSALITSSFLNVLLLSTNMLRKRACGTPTMFLGYWQPQKEPTASRALYQRPDTAGTPLLVRRLLSKLAESRMASSIIKGMSRP